MIRTDIPKECLWSGNTEASSKPKAMQACGLAGIPMGAIEFRGRA